MPDKLTATTIHTLLHAAKPAMCSTDWSEMEGDDCMRTCPQCSTAAFHADRMEPEVFCSEARKLKPLLAPLRAYRRSDGTYTFSDKNCSPKGMLVPQKSDLRAVMITNWWADRYLRYNKYLGYYGLALGLLCVATCLINAGIASACYAIAAFFVYGTICAIGGNLLFAACIVINLLTPGFVWPIRKYGGPFLLGASMLLTGVFISVPIVWIAGMWHSHF
jgi:hypothetical protein